MISNYLSSQTGELYQTEDLDQPGWTRCEKPTDADRAFLVGMGVDEDILHDALDPHEVPRLSVENKWTYFITRAPETDTDLNDFSTPILFAFDGNNFITLSRGDLGRLWDPFVRKTRVSVSQQKRLFLLMIDYIAQSYQSRVATINRQMRAAMDNLSGLRSRDIAIIVDYERELNDHLDALIPTNDAIEKLLGSRSSSFLKDDKDEIEDLSIDIEQVIARCKSLLRTIQNLRDSYRAVMDTRLNETMRVLTIVTVVLTIPTMLAGLLGMNVKLPFDVDSDLVFWEIVGSSVVAAAAVSYYFTKR